MKTYREIRTQRKRRRAERNLEKMLNHYSHNSIILHLQVTSYLHKFCKDKYGKINPDSYIESYIERIEDNLRERAE